MFRKDRCRFLHEYSHLVACRSVDDRVSNIPIHFVSCKRGTGRLKLRRDKINLSAKLHARNLLPTKCIYQLCRAEIHFGQAVRDVRGNRRGACDRHENGTCAVREFLLFTRNVTRHPLRVHPPCPPGLQFFLCL